MYLTKERLDAEMAERYGKGAQNPKGITKQICDAAARRFRSDASESYYARNLVLATLQELYRREYQGTKWFTGNLLPIKQSVNEGAREYGYLEIGKAGTAELVSDNSTDIPDATITGEYTVKKVHTVAISFEYSTQDVRQARLQGFFDVAQEKGLAAREGHDQKINQLIRTGDTFAGLEGITNHPGIFVRPADTGNWATATAAQIVDDFSSAFTQIIEDTDGVEAPNHAVFPISTWRRISTLQNSVASDISVLEYLQRTHPSITRWEWEEGMEDVGSGDTPAVLLYANDPTRSAVVMPMALRPLAPQEEGLRFKVVLESRYGGVIAPRPRSILRLDGV